MAFVNTQPAPINQGDSAAEWARFRIRNAGKQATLLRDLCRNDTPLVLGAPGGGPTLSAALWSADEQARRLHFKINADAQVVGDISNQVDMWAAAYVDDNKLQFQLAHVQLGFSQGQLVLSAATPEQMYLLPRRRTTRVKRNDPNGPMVRFAHLQVPNTVCKFRLLDVSSTGCAMLCPAHAPFLEVGLLLKKVEIELDENTILYCDLLVHHITAYNWQQRANRVGCEWQAMPAAAHQRLLDWMRQGRRRRDLLSLNLE